MKITAAASMVPPMVRNSKVLLNQTNNCCFSERVCAGHSVWWVCTFPFFSFDFHSINCVYGSIAEWWFYRCVRPYAVEYVCDLGPTDRSQTITVNLHHMHAQPVPLFYNCWFQLSFVISSLKISSRLLKTNFMQISGGWQIRKNKMRREYKMRRNGKQWNECFCT